MRSIHNKTTSIIHILILATMLYVPASAAAYMHEDNSHGRGSGQHHEQKSHYGIWKNQELIAELELTEGQIQQLREADFSHREKTQEIKAQFKKTKLQMDKELTATSPDESKILDLAQQVANLKGQLYTHGVKSRLEMFNILTTEQQQSLKTKTRKIFGKNSPDRSHGRYCKSWNNQ